MKDILREGEQFMEGLSKLMHIMHSSSNGVLHAVQDGQLFGLHYGFSMCLLRAERLLGNHADAHGSYSTGGMPMAQTTSSRNTDGAKRSPQATVASMAAPG